MLTGLQVLSLACKCVFHGPEHNAKGRESIELNFERLKNQHLNVPTNRAQRVDEKNRFTCLVITFTSRIKVIKMSKSGSLFELFADGRKKSVSTVWEKYLSASERSHSLLSENAMDYWILDYC